MRVVFFGTPDWSVPALEGLLDSRHEVIAAVTRPDRARGRGRRSSPCPVAARAAEAGVPLLQPETLKDRGFRADLGELGGDIAVVVAYGRIVPRGMLRAMPRGYVNLHFSLLPRHRGAAPVQRTILAGDERSGVTSMQMDPGMDTGDVLLARETQVHESETAGELGARLAVLGVPLLLETLAGLESGTLKPCPQDESRATLAPPIAKEEAWVDWSSPATEIARRVRAFRPWPVARTRAGGKELRLLAASVADRGSFGAPGEILALDGDAILVACGGGPALSVEQLQPAGGRPMAGRAAVAGRHLALGSRMAPPPAAGEEAARPRPV